MLISVLFRSVTFRFVSFGSVMLTFRFVSLRSSLFCLFPSRFVSFHFVPCCSVLFRFVEFLSFLFCSFRSVLLTSYLFLGVFFQIVILNWVYKSCWFSFFISCGFVTGQQCAIKSMPSAPAPEWPNWDVYTDHLSEAAASRVLLIQVRCPSVTN